MYIQQSCNIVTYWHNAYTKYRFN